MPGLVRKLLIFAAVDGIILQPAPPRNHPPTTQQAIKIDYKGNVGPLLKDRRDADTAPVSLEAQGIVGILKIATSFFLITISSREQVAQIRGKSIYKITDVALIPLASQKDANEAIVAAQEHMRRHRNSVEGEDDTHSESEDEAPSVTDSLVDEHVSAQKEVKDPITAQLGSVDKRTSVAEDVMQKKGLYGRFANKWFSKTGWSADSRRSQGLSSDEDLTRKNANKDVDSTVPPTEEQPTNTPNPESLTVGDEDIKGPISPDEIPKAFEGSSSSTSTSLLPKILRTTKMYFASGNFYFSYDYDLSHGIDSQQSNSSAPLFRHYDPLYFWNQHIISPFINAGQTSFVLPIIQGFVGQRPFSIKIVDSRDNSVMIDPDATPDDIQLQSWKDKNTDSDSGSGVEVPLEPSNGKAFLLTLISRRSTKRAGLRYLRRGVDDEGHAANSVETEQILSSPNWDSFDEKCFSFTQYRGSIPLFFSQSPYSLKPQVNTWGSPETNAQAFKEHFADLTSRYGSIYCTSLVDKHATEAKIGNAYESHTRRLNSEGGIDGQGRQLGFEWFDFHSVCRGMHFEKVSILLDTLSPFLKESSWTEIANGAVEKKQSGVLRTNCMDCLDRTNVVQSACARAILESQLSAGNCNIDLQNDPSTSWFNNLWADNGDAISRQYAGTAALKGDFTRTRKRQITGALTDFGLTLTRYYNNIVNDYFAQAVIDYLLGRATDSIFSEFEADMKSSDYFIDVRKVRQAAIERSAGIVIEDQEEDLIAGWTLSAPTAANELKTATFEEAVLLLTEKALYFCRLDWGTEKVREFERVGLEQIDGIFRGVYITSTLGRRHVDEQKNVGFVVRYRSDPSQELVRRNTRSLESEEKHQSTTKKAEEEAGRFLAFKALPPRSTLPSATSPESSAESEVDVVKNISDEIAKIANRFRRRGVLDEGFEIKDIEPEEKDIISAADARKSTGYLEQLGYSLKKLVWA
ncbi:hypothetical protein BU24DRAFT_427397 [Aaosphaeria arxii CBS 175.79]|uniref:SacI domain-containing protein n=1 Tax=Aaosphaeria arxii CBS 175.79 TaxID=1450172 RepID=A0A6A5XDH8_9PLEO|nr:uncharacterized protein BU24DRAFT_427397 [Aaosphaeria arxii CBS 175.79]KAF2011185.1 hypothetical protein BU24DRAFT_427397 [Aaosphaeria arxii CBS 175.79]